MKRKVKQSEELACELFAQPLKWPLIQITPLLQSSALDIRGATNNRVWNHGRAFQPNKFIFIDEKYLH
jgi:hypothetical protein